MSDEEFKQISISKEVGGVSREERRLIIVR
jgi:hypothetical protein